MSQKVYVVAVFFRDRLDFGVTSPENMLSPLFIVERGELDPALKIFVLTLDDALLPLLVSADVTVLVKAVVAMVLGLLFRVDNWSLLD